MDMRNPVGQRIIKSAAWAMLAASLCLALLLTSSLVFAISPTIVATGCAISSLVSAFCAFLILREKQVPQIVETSPTAAETIQERLRLLATMSHEIRTPLNGVVGMINLMQETPLTMEQQNYAATANSSARTLLSIVDEALDTAKGQVTNLQQSGLVAIRPLVENVTELMSARAHAKATELSAYVAADVPEQIVARDLALRQILFNLVGNAIKFTETGGVGVSISMRGQTVIFEIEDTGIGMTPGECERIFAEYQQANSETSKRFGGTGLGLSITRNLVAQMGGTISVKSATGRGSVFTVSLPQTNQAVVAVERILPLEGRRVWLASEQVLTGRHATRMIEDLGGLVTQVTSRDELKMLLANAAEPEDCIICTAGHAEVLRAWAKTAVARTGLGPKIWVMLTAEERRPCRDLLKAPFAGYLLKPMRLATLLSRLGQTDGQVLRQTARRLRAATPALPKSRKHHILVADDNAVNVLLVSTMLRKMGHKVTHVSSGMAVLDLIEAQKSFDALLLDIEMPGLNGYETTLLLRQSERQSGRPRLPVMALTAHTRADEWEKCRAAGMDGYLTKPFDQQDLEEALSGLTTRRAA
jgi:signal transduction histidine kinase/CheY-like chemotaxis protein